MSQSEAPNPHIPSKPHRGAAPERVPEPATPPTWAMLLGHWVELARAAVALPATGEDGRVRASVPDLVALQAVAFALEQLDALDPAERGVGLDRAAVLIERHAEAIRRRWGGAAVPASCVELIDEAWSAWRFARQQGGGAGERRGGQAGEGVGPAEPGPETATR